jgi:hypothetical protein
MTSFNQSVQAARKIAGKKIDDNHFERLLKKSHTHYIKRRWQRSGRVSAALMSAQDAAPTTLL